MVNDVTLKVRQYFSRYPLRTYPKGQILIFADENPDHIFYLISGKVREYDISHRGEEIIVNIFKPPAFFPMSWPINHVPSKFFFKTEQQTEAHTVPANDALEFLKANPDVVLDLLSRVYRGMEGLLGRVVHLMSGTARGRLIYELILESRRFGKTLPTGDTIVTVTETGLAARSGLTRETISREMSRLREQGWAKLTPKGIVIRDIDALEKTLGAEL